MFRTNASHNQVDSGSLTIRRAGAADRHSLTVLAALDSAPVPGGDALVAERDGRLVAALPVAGGRALADPFEPTAEVLSLLELRARQLRPADAPRESSGGLARRLRTRLA
jgi:hypothetical protein